MAVPPVAISNVKASGKDVGSNFGALLDMIADRCGDVAILLVLMLRDQGAWKYYIGMALLDVIAHWLIMIS
jgi:phosphatidylglycerophosphate synthase